MAAERGQFLHSLEEGLKRILVYPTPGRRQRGPGGGKPGSGSGSGSGRVNAGGRRFEMPLRAATGDQELSGPRTRTERQEADSSRTNVFKPELNFIERLPTEILIKILSYLDTSSLCCISHVSKLFHKLANDDVVWHKIYMSKFGKWKPKSPASGAAVRAEPEEVEDRPQGHWRKLYFWTMAGHEVNVWKKELKHIDLNTGLPRHTEWVLRYLGVSWELTLYDCTGWKQTLEHCRASFLESSVIVCWSGDFPQYHQVSSIQLHGVQRRAPRSPVVRNAEWRSMMLKLDMKTRCARYIGKDRLIKMIHLWPGFIIGIWRSRNKIAFIMACLHFHRLVERSLLGSPVGPYLEPADPPPLDKSDPESGLRGFTLHLALHGTGTKIMDRHFQLSFCTVVVKRGLMELKVVHRRDLALHRSLTGSIKLPWRSDSLEGAVENCCVLTLTLLDEFQRPFWCVSSPVCIRMANPGSSLSGYSGEHFRLEHCDSEGKVEMRLVWLTEEKQFFLIALSVYVPLAKVNQHFGTKC